MSDIERPLKILVAGGSIGGLSAGVALNAAGFDVEVYERVPGPMETRGAGIVVQGELLQLLRDGGARALPTTQCSVRRYLSPDGGDGQVQRMPQAFTSWEAIYATLRSAFPTERYHMGSALSGLAGAADDRGVSAQVDGAGRIEADLLGSGLIAAARR